MSRVSAVRFSHFLPSLLLLLAGLSAAYVKDLSVFFTSLFNVLPTLVLLLGGSYCAVYRRQRELFLMITVYIAYFLLDTQTDFYRDNGRVREDAAVVFAVVRTAFSDRRGGRDSVRRDVRGAHASPPIQSANDSPEMRS